jgi:hypothetical protein
MADDGQLQASDQSAESREAAKKESLEAEKKESLLKELQESTLQTWRFQVDSFWQRSSYFAAFETVALGLCWKALGESLYPGRIFAVLGGALTVIWFWNNAKTYSYVKYWWDRLREIESQRGLDKSKLDLSEQIENPEKIMSAKIRRPLKGIPYHWVVQFVPILFFIAWVLLYFSPSFGWVKSGIEPGKKEKSSLRYFDAHNHGINAILPYYAYADLPTFIADPGDPTKVSPESREALWKHIVLNQLSREPKRTGPDNRIAPGAIGTIEAYDVDKLTPRQVNGALERVLTSTPWTEFDSAYAFRGSPVEGFLKLRFSSQEMSKALCHASILELAFTHTDYSEQFVNFIAGWKPRIIDGHPISDRLDTVRCFMNEPDALAAAGALQGMPKPEIKVLLMTNTRELGAVNGNGWMHYATESGTCERTELDSKQITSPNTIQNALLGNDDAGKSLLDPSERTGFLNTVIGIDTAGPEITCFTKEGMERFKELAKAVYRAALDRRGKMGWHGKLLVHTHVGEGGAVYQITKLPHPPGDLFKSFPALLFNKNKNPVYVDEGRRNIDLLIGAVESLKFEIPEIQDYVVFRFGHVTQAQEKQAQDMKRLHIEADINLDSNLATSAYYVPPPSFKTKEEELKEEEQFDYNDWPDVLRRTGKIEEVLANHSLKLMLKAGVRTLLGTDGSGVEHSNIAQEYQLAESLVAHWRYIDPTFPPDISIKTIQANVEEHLRDMKEDTRIQ